MSFFFLLAKFYNYWCRHVKVTANEKVGCFLRHSDYPQFYNNLVYYECKSADFRTEFERLPETNVRRCT